MAWLECPPHNCVWQHVILKNGVPANNLEPSHCDPHHCTHQWTRSSCLNRQEASSNFWLEFSFGWVNNQLLPFKRFCHSARQIFKTLSMCSVEHVYSGPILPTAWIWYPNQCFLTSVIKLAWPTILFQLGYAFIPTNQKYSNAVVSNW